MTLRLAGQTQTMEAYVAEVEATLGRLPITSADRLHIRLSYLNGDPAEVVAADIRRVAIRYVGALAVASALGLPRSGSQSGAEAWASA